MNKRGLGRGLDALLSSAPGTDEATTDIPVDQIDVWPGAHADRTSRFASGTASSSRVIAAATS